MLNNVYARHDLNALDNPKATHAERYEAVLSNLKEPSDQWGPEAKKVFDAWVQHHAKELFQYAARHWYQYAKLGIDLQSGIDAEIEEVI